MTTSVDILPSDAPPRLKHLLRQWQEIAETGPPTMADLSFEALLPEHSGLALLEPVRGDGDVSDFRCLRVGPEHAAQTNTELEGSLISEIMHPEAARMASAGYREALETGQPQYWEFVNSVYGSTPIEFCRLLLPLHDAAGEVVSLIGSWVWKQN